MSHLVLVGGMAVGKSTAGQVVADRLGRPLRDSDVDIEHDYGITGRALAQRRGVSALHRLEAGLLLDALASRQDLVIAAAASVVEDERCVGALLHCDVVWLRARPDTVIGRMAGSTHRRQIDGDSEPSVAHLMRSRAPRYATVADVVIDVDDMSPDDVADAIVRELNL